MFPKVVEKFGELVQNDKKVILEGKVQVREEEINIAVNEVRAIENIDLYTLKMNDELSLEENVFLKEILAKHKGNNPVVIDFEDEGARRQLVVNRHIWVDNSPEIATNIERYFKDRIELDIKALG